jgi:hypothetical protein
VYIDREHIGNIGFRKRQLEFEEMLNNMLSFNQLINKNIVEVVALTNCLIARYKIKRLNGRHKLEYIEGVWDERGNSGHFGKVIGNYNRDSKCY